MLVGSGVRDLYEDNGQPVYVFLLSMDWDGDLQDEPVKALDCFQKYNLNPKRHTAKIRDTNITINICDVAESCNALDYRDHTIFEDIHQLIAGKSIAILNYKGSEELEIFTSRSPIPPTTYHIKLIFEQCRDLDGNPRD